MKVVNNLVSTFKSLVCLILLPVISWAQINSGNPAIPFGSNKKYKYGIMPTNLPTTGTYGLSQDAANLYTAWKTKWVVNCTDGSQRVNWDDNSSTVSEGIGYGMLLAAYAGDKTLFDNLWKYYKTWSSSSHGLMHWKITGCASIGGSGSASDADIDAAMALIVAAKQWPLATSPYKYSTEATTIINAIGAYNINSSSYQLINGDGWGTSTCRNPSYQAPGYYKIYGLAVSGQSAFWTKATDAANTMLNANVNSTTGLVSNWCDNTGAPNGCNGNNEYGDDACRNPWRMCVDAVWNNGTTATNICTLLAKYIQGKGVTVVGGNVPQTGGNGLHTSMYVSTFATSVMGSNSTYQNTLNGMYTEAKAINTTGYFQDILKTISFFVMTGNFWNPYDVANCKSPIVGGNKTLCGTSGSLTLNASLATTTGRTFTWYKNMVAIANSNTSTLNVSSAGTYTVKVDSSNGCSSRDSSVISSTLPVVNLGANQSLCSPATTTLDAGVSGTGISYQWKYSNLNFANLATISNETSQTLTNVRSAGLYQVTVSASGCTSVSDTITVKSSNPSPVDGCNATSGTVKLSIANPGLNGTNYNWFAASTGGAALATGSTSFTTPIISQSTTYYVQDMSAVSGTVGPAAMLGTSSSQQNWGCGQTNTINFTANANFTLKALSIPINVYNIPASGTLSIEIVDGSNTVKGTFTSDIASVTSASGIQLVRFTFGSGNGVLIDKNTWGATLKMRLANSCLTLGGAPMWTQNVTPSFPYTSTGNIVSITGAELSGSASTTNYMYFYNWEISTGTTCDRLPVVASINSSCTVTGTEETKVDNSSSIMVFPNPSSSSFSLIYDQNQQGISHLQVFDKLGRVVFQKEVKSGEQIYFGEDLEHGIYHCRISYNGGVVTKSLIKR